MWFLPGTQSISSLEGCASPGSLDQCDCASTFLQIAGQLLFGSQRRNYTNPTLLERGSGWTVMIADKPVIITYTGIFTLVLSITLLVALYTIVQRTKLGRSMRAVAENKQVAALMGIDVDGVISRTFIISGALAGAAGVMWGIHNGLVYYFIGFIGIKAFTAAVLGGIIYQELCWEAYSWA